MPAAGASGARHGRHATAATPCCWAGVLLVFLFFTAAGGKREVYILPMLPLLAVALGPTLVRIADAAWLRRTALAATLLIGTALAGRGRLGAVGPLGPHAAGDAGAWPGR